MRVLADMKMYARFGWGLPGFLRHRITLEEAKAIVRQRLREREANFLRLVEKGIFGYPRSPYLPLLKLAQVELGDIQNMVRSKGLEDTLRALREAGVHVTFEEFKGREPIVRDGKVVPVRAHDFDNPYLRHYYEAETGGTTGAGTRIPIDLDHIADQAPHLMLTRDAHNVLDVPTAIWFGVLPDPTGVKKILRTARYGQVVEKWFSPVATRDSIPTVGNRLATYFIVIETRLLGVAVPWPKLLRLDQASTVAHWAAEASGRHGACLVLTHVSKALRVCVSAQKEGLDLTGATFMGGGESPTPAKVREITRSGARYVPTYFFDEVGAVGLGCVRPTDVNDLHLLTDGLALIQYPRRVPGSENIVDAFNFTTLLPSAPKLLLNVESDDFGVLETRSCGCALESLGYMEHLREIRSFRKLTGEGVTLVGSEMVHILEDVLPARFGGSPLDYQLLEEEDDDGFTRLSLLVSPAIELADEEVVVEAVLEALGQGSVAADLARTIWGQARTLRVKRVEPVWSARGKLMPLRMARRSERPRGSPADTG